ncbi:MAG: alpha-mannosidase [Rikenellaceae bacterium]|nr:alpha-mannosidase [Rikenellaceae bacterium]
MKKLQLLAVGLFAVLAVTAQQKKEYKTYMVSNAHFDSQWNWDVQQSIREYVRNTVLQQLWLLDNYPDYVANFEGAVKYEWMKEYFPTEYERVKEYIKQGRWHIPGSTYDATDPNMPSAESFFRNILLGQHYYMDEFGIKSTDIFLPDCFGFGYQLPTIAAHSGVTGFSTQKLQWRQKPFYGDAKVPFKIGLWEGVDGSRLIAALDARDYNKRYDGEDISHDPEILEMAKDGYHNMGLRYYGTGDIGGSPTIESVVAVERGIKGDGPVQIISAASDQLFKELMPFENHPDLPVFNGELLMDVHATGCYTSQSAMKAFNRRNEQLADGAERASVIADWMGGLPYSQKKITDSWKRFIWHQFHDDLTGTSIPRAYEFSWNDELISQTQFNDVIEAATGAVSRELNTAVKGTPVIVYNILSQPRQDLVRAAVPMAKAPKGVTVVGPDGKSVPAQVVAYADGVADIVFSADVEPVSYAVYDVRPGGSSKAAVKAEGKTIENSVYTVTLDDNGDIASIVDKRNGKELVEKGKAFRLAMFTDNESFEWPAWEIMKKTMDADPVPVTEDVKITVEESGPARGVLRVDRKFGTSAFTQRIILTEGAADDRIDVVTDVDWDSKNALLKAEFPMSVSNPEATYDLGVGTIKRGNNTPTAYEVFAQQWADLTAADGSYGVSIMNNNKYGWDKPNDNTLRLTLLHTPKTKKENFWWYQDTQDLGHHTFTYSISGHEGDNATDISWKAEAMNQPLLSFIAPKHTGKLGREFSFVKTSTPQVAIEALKKAEKSDDYVIRLYETAGQPVENAEVIFASEIESAKELNGIEEVIGDVKVDGNKLIFSTTAFKPKTFSVKLKAPATKLAAAQNTFVALPFNDRAYTPDAFRNTANFDGEGNSYSAELMPAEINSDGVIFQTGPVDGKHVVKSRGEKIDLPAMDKAGKLYLLVAATDKDREATFKIDGKEYTVGVPYYSGFYGQWGYKGHTEGYVKDADIAFVGTHRHNYDKGNEPYVFTYLYKVALDVPAGAKTLELPDDQNIAVFAATLSDNPNDVIVSAFDSRALPKETAK